MTMNKNILWMVFGAALLTGCPDEVMQQRRYVPADDPAAGGKTTVNEVLPDPAGDPQKRQMTVEERTPDDPVKTQSTAEESKPASRQNSEFRPMTGTFDNSGVSSDEDEVAAPGEYIVRNGDTLGKIAANHHVKLAALMKANKLTAKDAKRLRVGQKLVIPGGKAAAGKTKSDSANAKSRNAKSGKGGKKAAAQESKATIQPGEYVIKAGDTPERIARRAKVRLKDLMAANNLTEDGAKRLRIGQKIVIPGKNGKTAAAPTQKPATQKQVKKTAAAQNTTQPKTEAAPQAANPAETVKKEDDAILNDMENPATTAPAISGTSQPAATGTAVNTDVDTPLVEVTEDISIADFSKKYNTTPEALRSANPDGVGDIIKKGQVILIPR